MGALCVSSIALRPCNHLERCTIGTARRAIGTCEAPLELREGHSLSAEREVDAGNR